MLTPDFRNGEFVFPFLEIEDSRHSLAFKMVALLGLERKSRTSDLVRDFTKMNRQDQQFVDYNLSHELKIATLAASIATTNQNRNVFEVGPCFGFSSIHYSHLMKEKAVHPPTPISRLIAIEWKNGYLQYARDIQRMAEGYAGEIEYVLGDGIRYLRKSLKEGDLVFSSVAEPRVVKGILGLSTKRSFDFVVSYSEKTSDKVRKDQGRCIEDLVDPCGYGVFPFEDREYNTHLTDDLRRRGVLALATKVRGQNMSSSRT